MSRYPTAIATLLLIIAESIGIAFSLILITLAMIIWFLPLGIIAIFVILVPFEVTLCLYLLVWTCVFLISVLTRCDARYSKRLTSKCKNFAHNFDFEDMFDRWINLMIWPDEMIFEYILEPLADDIERRYKWLNGK